MEYYTYAYLREDDTPYYIGKGKGKRLYYKYGKNCKPPKDRSRIIKLKQNLTEEEAFKHEIYMINVFGKKCDGTGILMNIADGGNAPPIISGDKHHMKTEKYKKRISEKLTGRKGHPAWNKGIPIKEEVRQKIIGEGNGVSQWWKLTFIDNRELVMCGLTNWCKKNGYSKGCLGRVASGERKRHKDIVAVEKLVHGPSHSGLDAL